MNSEKRNFDKEAVNWDENPVRVKMAEDVKSAISQHITLTQDMDIMDFGCGTGLIALHLAPLVKSVTGADSSQGMLDILIEKAEKQALDNVRTLKIDPDSGDTLSGCYDLIVSNMAFHHIENIEPLLSQLYSVLKPSGYICISDLDPDDGHFHIDSTGVFHNGFDRIALRSSFKQAGFNHITDITATEIVKPIYNGDVIRFTIFMMYGQK
jgi:2-polyprenyl-3-methyl-5-hydroxy-6-metoxy-1,4-benzoquinol methylase